MGYTRDLMIRWWWEEDRQALERLLAVRALYSETRDLGNVVAAYGEYLVCRAVGGERLRQAGGEGDCRPPKGRVIEVKTTSHPTRGWTLQYAPGRNDYALVRLNLEDWRVVEAWFLPMTLARRHVRGRHNRISPNGPWRADARPLPLHRY